MAKNINLVNEKNGQTLVAPSGFSWTTFFFGVFPSLFRRDWKGFGIMVLGAVIVYLLSSNLYGGGILNWVYNIGLGFIYNALYIRNMVKDHGFKAADNFSQEIVDKSLNLIKF